MKNYLPLTVLTLVSALPAVAQTKPATTAAHPLHPVSACAKTPVLSPKIPTLPAEASCAKSLLRFTVTPNAKLDYVSPLVDKEIVEGLGLAPVTFSLDYIDAKVGTGPLALPHKFYTLQYTGYLTDGTKFDSSLDRSEPFTFPVGQHRVIAGWDLGFQGMHVGGKRRLFIPFQLAYGDKPQQAIPPKSELIFDIELLSQSDEEPKKPTPPAPPAPAAKPATPPATPVDPSKAPAAAPAKPLADPTKPTVAPAPATPPAGAPPTTSKP